MPDCRNLVPGAQNVKQCTGEVVAEERKLEILDRKTVVMLDGAYGSLLMEMGLAPGRPPDECNLVSPEKVSKVHRRYLDAGSDIILTNTFGSNRIKARRSGLGDNVRALNLAGARLARDAAGEKALVAGDIGPTGELLEPYGSLPPKDAQNGFREQAEALYEGGVDLIIIETMFDLGEALLALGAAMESTPLPVIVSLTFEKRGGKFATIMGNRVESSFSQLAGAGACAVGANCSVGSKDMAELAGEMVRSTSLPVIAQPNAGSPSLDGSIVSYEADPEEFAGDILRIVGMGAKLVGGCCGTNPDFMKLVRGKLDEKR